MTVLGIDLGTTSVKVTLVAEKDLTVSFSSSRQTNAYKETQNLSLKEQDTCRIYECLSSLLKEIDSDLLASVNHVAISGQMHGVVFWGTPVHGSSEEIITSELITWEDQRCDENFLTHLPKPESNIPISSGFGCASIFWLVQNKPNHLERWTCAGTISDHAAAYLGGLSKPMMSPQSAASWGYFNSTSLEWETKILEDAGFPVHLLPNVVMTGEPIGRVKTSRFGIPVGATIYVALGDLQASVFACVQQRKGQAVVNVGTSSQLVLPLESASSLLSNGTLPTSVTVVPYFGRDTKLAVVASLNGGNVLSYFVELLQNWCQDLGCDIGNKDVIWERLAKAAETVVDVDASELAQVRATLFGERHLSQSNCCAAVEKLIPGRGMKLGAIYIAVCRGLTDNLLEMMKAETLDACQTEAVVGVGSALRRNPVLFSAFKRTFARWFSYMNNQDLDASMGAALSVCLGLTKGSDHTC